MHDELQANDGRLPWYTPDQLLFAQPRCEDGAEVEEVVPPSVHRTPIDMNEIESVSPPPVHRNEEGGEYEESPILMNLLGRFSKKYACLINADTGESVVKVRLLNVKRQERTGLRRTVSAPCLFAPSY